MLQRATNFTGSGLASWDVSSVVHMNDAFSHAPRFEGIGLEDWQTSSVVSFQNTFQYATSFNRDLSDWSLDRVVSIQAMFQGASSMHQSLCWPSLVLSTLELGDDRTGRDGTVLTTPMLGPVTVLTHNFNCDSPVRLDPCCVSSKAVMEQTCCSSGLVEEETGCDTFCATPPTSAPTATTSTATLEPTVEPTFQDAMDDGNGTVVFEPTDMDGDGTAVFEPSDMDGANAITNNADVSFVEDAAIPSSEESSDATTMDGSSSDDGDQDGNVGAMTVGFLGGFAGIIAMIVIVSHVLATRRRLVDGDLDMLTIKPSTSIETNASWETTASSPRQEIP